MKYAELELMIDTVIDLYGDDLSDTTIAEYVKLEFDIDYTEEQLLELYHKEYLIIKQHEEDSTIMRK